MPDKSSVWFQFFDKETQNDIDYDFEYERQYKSNSLEYTHKYPTTTRKEIWSWWLYEWANRYLIMYFIIYVRLFVDNILFHI